MIDKSLLKPGVTVYRDVKGKRKTRTVTREWDGVAARAELSGWGISLGWRTTNDWDRVEWSEGARVKRGTRTGLARWAHGIEEAS